MKFSILLLPYCPAIVAILAPRSPGRWARCRMVRPRPWCVRTWHRIPLSWP